MSGFAKSCYQSILFPMPSFETSAFKFELPGEWAIFEDGHQVVAHGPESDGLTELIISRTSICRGGTSEDPADTTELVESRVVQLMQRNAQHPELATTGELSEETLAAGMRLRYLRCQSADGSTVFDQFALIALSEVVYLTYEGPVAATQAQKSVWSAIKTAQFR